MPGGKPGKFPRLGKGLFLIQKLPREEMRLLLRSPPPHLSLLVPLCFATAFPSAFPSLRWVGFCGRFFFVLPFPRHFPPRGEARGIPTGWSRGTDPLRRGWQHRAAAVTWLCPCISAPLGAPGRCYLAAGVILEPVQKSLSFLSWYPATGPVTPRADCSCPPSPLRCLHKQELNGFCF